MDPKLEGNIGHWIKRINRHITSTYDAKLSPYGLTTSQISVLARLWNAQDGLTQTEMQQFLDIRPASLTNLLDALVAGGWIVRKVDSQDARVKRVFLTDKGREVEDVCMNIINETQKSLTRGFTNEEIALMLLWLKRLDGNM